MQYDVAIIGAGVVGAAVARELTRLGARVTMLEKESDVATGASRANSGIVHAGFDAKEGSLKARLNVRGSEMMADLCRRLDVTYDPCGSLVVAFGAEEDETLLALCERGRRNGVKGLAILSGDEAREREPALSLDVTSALYAPTGAVVCPYELTVALAGVAIQNGAHLLTEAPVEDMVYDGERWHLTTPKGEVLATYAVNCAGVYSDRVAALAGDLGRFSVTARKGEYLLLDREAEGLVRHTVFMAPSKMGKGVLVSPTAHGNVIVGPTALDIDEKDDLSTTPEGLAQVRSLAAKSVPSIPFGKGITCFSGLRAVGSLGDFVIDMPRPHFVNCAAIESPGLSASPAIAEYVAGLLREAGLALSAREDFADTYVSAVAFRRLSAEQKNEIIRRDPRYGRIVCRCETVTEGELVEAIHKEPRPTTMDGLKRRTRCGMGRCQGGFCTPYVTEILARETGRDLLSVTRSGEGSALLVGRTKE